jgi:hypothetical protein
MGGHVARIGEKRGVYRVWVGKAEAKRQLGRTGEAGRITLRWSFMKWDVGVWPRLSWIRIGTVGGHL